MRILDAVIMTRFWPNYGRSIYATDSSDGRQGDSLFIYFLVMMCPFAPNFWTKNHVSIRIFKSFSLSFKFSKSELVYPQI